MPFKPGPDLKAGLFGTKTPPSMPSIASTINPPKPPPASGPKGLRVEDRIGIQAPAEVIWEIVKDLERWSEWNPTYPEAHGQVRIGEVLSVKLVLPGQPVQMLAPKVLDWVPNEQLHWQLTMMGGLIKTVRYVEIEARGEQNCIVDNGEIFGGLMGPSLGKRMGRTIQRGFKAMNEALKDRAEAQWRARQG